MKLLLPLAAALLVMSGPPPVADVELTETRSLPECHSLGWVGAWVRANPGAADGSGWDGVLDEAKWGVPSPQQAIARNWDWKLTDDQWQQAVKAKGQGKTEDVRFDLWLPAGVPVVRGVVVVSGHGSGEALFRHPGLRALARELHLGLFKFVGNPVQRGFWPRGLLYDRLAAFAKRSGHPEVGHAPLFLYGHSNGTGFSAIFPATEGARVWGWVSMRPGTTFQVYQPGAAQVPGLVIFGEDDPFLARPSKAENLAVVPLMRKKHASCGTPRSSRRPGTAPGRRRGRSSSRSSGTRSRPGSRPGPTRGRGRCGSPRSRRRTATSAGTGTSRRAATRRWPSPLSRPSKGTGRPRRGS
jgi:hypothetical protein